jgi:hypothetical protein
MKQISKRAFISKISMVIALALTMSIAKACEEVKVGDRYEVVGTLYAHGVYLDLNVRQLSIIILGPVRARGPEVAFEREIPKGTVITISGNSDRRSPFGSNRYFVELSPTELPSDVNIVLELHRGNEGESTPLNPQIFRKVQ